MGLIQLPQVREILNRARADAGLPPLSSSRITSLIARGYAPTPTRRLDRETAYDEAGLPVWVEAEIRVWATEQAEAAARRLRAREGG